MCLLALPVLELAVFQPKKNGPDVVTASGRGSVVQVRVSGRTTSKNLDPSKTWQALEGSAGSSQCVASTLIIYRQGLKR